MTLLWLFFFLLLWRMADGCDGWVGVCVCQAIGSLLLLDMQVGCG